MRILPAHPVLTLGCSPARQRDELAQIPPPCQIVRQGNHRETGGSLRACSGTGIVCGGPTSPVQRHHKFGTWQQFEPQLFRLDMGTHHAGYRTFVSNGQCPVAQRMGARHQFVRVRSTTLEAEIAQAMQLGVSRQGRHHGRKYADNTAKYCLNTQYKQKFR